MIEEAIIKPIEDYMTGNGELHRLQVRTPDGASQLHGAILYYVYR